MAALEGVCVSVLFVIFILLDVAPTAMAIFLHILAPPAPPQSDTLHGGVMENRRQQQRAHSTYIYPQHADLINCKRKMETAVA